MAEELKSFWQTLTATYSSNQTLIETLWQEIKNAYTSENRHYHNLNHLGFMLELAKRYEKQLKNPDAVAFAIFYHDFSYENNRSDNEAQSAEMASDRLFRLSIPENEIAFVQKAILATKTHEPSSDADINFLLDFDLAILGADRETYLAYAKSIRQEYSIYPDDVYKAGRIKVIQHFLAQPAIFKTPLFRTLLEAKAHHNLQAELQNL